MPLRHEGVHEARLGRVGEQAGSLRWEDSLQARLGDNSGTLFESGRHLPGKQSACSDNEIIDLILQPETSLDPLSDLITPKKLPTARPQQQVAEAPGSATRERAGWRQPVAEAAQLPGPTPCTSLESPPELAEALVTIDANAVSGFITQLQACPIPPLLPPSNAASPAAAGRVVRAALTAAAPSAALLQPSRAALAAAEGATPPAAEAPSAATAAAPSAEAPIGGGPLARSSSALSLLGKVSSSSSWAAVEKGSRSVRWLQAASDDEDLENGQPDSEAGGGWSADGVAKVRADVQTSFVRKMSLSFISAAYSFREATLGDDEAVLDRWDDNGKGSLRLASRESSVASRHSGSGKVWAADAAQEADTSVSAREKRQTRTLLWYYGQTILYSIFVACFCLPIVAGLSSISWSSETGPDALSNSANSTKGAEAFAIGGNSTTSGVPVSSIVPNMSALQFMLPFQLLFPLCIYAILLFICMRKTLRIPVPLLLTVGATIAWATAACVLIRVYNISYWFYYIDLFMIVAVYVPCVCAVGWCIDDRPEATTKERLKDMLLIGLLEVLVAAATLIYCIFIMPNFFVLTSAWLQLLWLCVLHPLYFELTTGFIVRKVLYRNRQLGRTDVVYFLSIVHSMVHSVALATSLQASIEPISLLAVSLTIYNASKLFWRSTVIPRDLYIERLFNGWSFTFPEEERAELARMVSVGILTEIILENTSVIVSPFMLYRMYNQPIFMSVVPNTFFNNGGGYPVKTLLSLMLLLFLFTVVFDLIFVFLNYYTTQCLPLISTWRRIKKAGLWYTLFLVYAFACMGVLFLFLTMLVLPRAAYCRSDNYCDCTTSTYDAICEGEYISMLVDYLVG